jgi:hypothetical protein
MGSCRICWSVIAACSAAENRVRVQELGDPELVVPGRDGLVSAA